MGRAVLSGDRGPESEVEFPGEVRKPRGQDVGCALHLDVEVAKNDDRSWEWRRTLRWELTFQ